MSTFLCLKQQQNQTIQQFFALTRDAEAHRLTELRAAVLIQKVFRGFRVRKRFEALHHAATTIRKLYKGFCARVVVSAMMEQRTCDRQLAYYHYMATVIQKRYRGYIVRKKAGDFYQKKKWLGQVTQKAQELRATLAKQLEEQQQQHEAEQKRVAQTQFEDMASGLHHLIGTKTHPGIFASPFGPEFTQRAFGTPMEDHIKRVFKERTDDKLRTLLYKPPPAAPTTRTVTLQATLRATMKATSSSAQSARPTSPITRSLDRQSTPTKQKHQQKTLVQPPQPDWLANAK